ncbi:MAG: cyclic lactone autoinducer peptide [Firmicutes bacterium]|jgi:cyclic lactone autoinducer peptide|nr:cyclic lactone autoinducer peptide [Bacillota bacterium]
MKRFAHWLLGVAVVGLMMVANVASASACFLGHYQPTVPKMLQK